MRLTAIVGNIEIEVDYNKKEKTVDEVLCVYGLCRTRSGEIFRSTLINTMTYDFPEALEAMLEKINWPELAAETETIED